MAVAVVMDFVGSTLDDYDRLLARMPFTPGGPGAPGGLFHWVAAIDTGIRVTDVWQTKEILDAFTQEQLIPLATELGIAPPQVTAYEVHNYFTQGPEVS